MILFCTYRTKLKERKKEEKKIQRKLNIWIIRFWQVHCQKNRDRARKKAEQRFLNQDINIQKIL